MKAWQRAGWQVFSIIVSVLLIAGLVFAAGKATPQEVKAKVKEAAKLLQEKGDEGLKILNTKNNPFVWKDTYVFVYNLDGKMIAHPVAPHLLNKDMMAIKDVDGKLFTGEFLEIAKGKGHGWSDYKWPKPGSREPSQKVSYIMKVPGKPWLVGAGIYDVSKAEAIKKAGD